MSALSLAAATQLWEFPFPRTIFVVGFMDGLSAVVLAFIVLIYVLLMNTEPNSNDDGISNRVLMWKSGIYVAIFSLFAFSFFSHVAAFSHCHRAGIELCAKKSVELTSEEKELIRRVSKIGVFALP